ncbi:zinc ribbon domain-containing protein [Candidatus Woesearchaeota archaeon]|nr:zinc ribbon domain-containing protein [Candidatus Woesearchaeota archaeon]
MSSQARDFLIQASQLVTGILYKLAKSDIKGAVKNARQLVTVLSNLALDDMAMQAQQFAELLTQGKRNEADTILKSLSEKINAKLEEETPHLHIAKEKKCPHCHADILVNSKFCSQCGKALT